MIVFRTRIPVSSARRSQVVGSLRKILGQTRVLPGCISCRLYADIEDHNRLVLVEEWADMHSFRAHVRADSFRVVLSALEYASDQPEVRLDTIANSRGLEFISASREGPDGQNPEMQTD